MMVCCLGVAPAQADTASEAGWGIGSALSSLVYAPVKVVYAILGTVFGGLAWGLSGGDSEVFNAVIIPSVRGDYVVTPSHLRGEQPLAFLGRAPGYDEPQPAIVQQDDPPAYGDVSYGY